MGEIRKDNLHESLIEELNELANIDLSGYQEKTDENLITESKDLVGAINELFQSANNGKELIANAIGEPVSKDDTFSAMSNDINGLLSTFKTNMMNNGIAIEAGDKFKSLIDKIATMVEEGSNKGIQMVNGEVSQPTGSKTYTKYRNYSNTIENEWRAFDYARLEFDFTPSILVTYQEYYSDIDPVLCYEMSIYTTLFDVDYIIVTGLKHYGPSSNSYSYVTYLSSNVNNGADNYYDVVMNLSSAISNYTYNKPLQWYAIGVGEEDTTLLDSLKSILAEEGVEVTEEDDMASLISKVDQEFNDKNNEIEENKGFDIISATELPATGNENQICVITDNPVNIFETTSDFSSISSDTSKIMLYLGNTSSNDGILGTLIPVTKNNFTINYYFNKIYQGGNRLSSYYYKNNNWKPFTVPYLELFKNGAENATSAVGTLNISGGYWQHNSNKLWCAGYSNNSNATSFQTKLDFTHFTKIVINANTNTSTRKLHVCATNTCYNSQTLTSTNYVSNNSVYEAYNTITSTDTAYTYDISSWIGEYYLTLEGAARDTILWISSIILY